MAFFMSNKIYSASVYKILKQVQDDKIIYLLSADPEKPDLPVPRVRSYCLQDP